MPVQMVDFKKKIGAEKLLKAVVFEKNNKTRARKKARRLLFFGAKTEQEQTHPARPPGLGQSNWTTAPTARAEKQERLFGARGRFAERRRPQPASNTAATSRPVSATGRGSPEERNPHQDPSRVVPDNGTAARTKTAVARPSRQRFVTRSSKSGQ